MISSGGQRVLFFPRALPCRSVPVSALSRRHDPRAAEAEARAEESEGAGHDPLELHPAWRTVHSSRGICSAVCIRLPA